MATLSWTRSFARFTSAGAIVALTCAIGSALDGNRADACGGWGPTVGELTSFDPNVLGSDMWEGLAYHPFDSSYGGACDACLAKAMLDDWHGFVGSAVKPADWDRVLMKASLGDIFAIEQRLAGKSHAAPKGYETSSLWADPAAAPRLYSAVEVVELLKRMEPQVTFPLWSDKPRPAPETTLGKELAAAQRGMAAAKEPFLRQRYAFAVMRALFYRHDWPAVIAFFDTNTAALSAPSEDLRWRARYYVAGALLHDLKAPRAYLELARVFAGYMPLAGLAMLDFRPSDDASWRGALALAKVPKERLALWSMVGIEHDALVGAQEIRKIDPSSPFIALLLIRELNKAETMVDRSFVTPPDPDTIAAQDAAFGRIAALAKTMLATAHVPRAYVYELVLEHLAAKSGDLAGTRSHATKALALAPNDLRVVSQANASLALALVANWKISPQAEQELAATVRGISADSLVISEIRSRLAVEYAAANRMIDAEFLLHGAYDYDGERAASIHTSWESAAFVNAMLARFDQRTTEFDRFVVSRSYTKEELLRELAIRDVLDGDFAGAHKLFATVPLKSWPLRSEPFVIHVIDCHDCDEEKYGDKARWTHQSLLDRMIQLDAKSKGTGEVAAAAALELGNALYNITRNGNAQTFDAGTHQDSNDAHLAERYYKRAYELTHKRELKAQAAWLAAKAELGGGNSNVIPQTWFPTFKTFADTAYYKEVLKDCGRFRNWVGSVP